MSAEPPFYRRLASLSQAALIHRQFVDLDVDAKFYEWALMNRGQQYYMQSFADMRLEPRWNPALAAAYHFKAEFIGRILIAGKRYEANIKDSGLYDLIVGAGHSSLHALCEFPHPFFPGPLEGSQCGANTMPTDLSKTIEAQLNADSFRPRPTWENPMSKGVGEMVRGRRRGGSSPPTRGFVASGGESLAALSREFRTGP